MMTKKILFISLFLTVAFSAAKTGTSIFRWAEIETGTRAIGMAGSQVASGNDISALPYNPASICFINKNEIFSSSSNYLAGTKHYTMAYGTKVSPSDFVGFHLFIFDSGEMPEAVAIEGQEPLTGKMFKFQGLAARLSYGRQMTDRLNLGATFKILNESVTSGDLSMTGIGFDIGSNFETGIYGMTLGMCISNFGPEARYMGDGLDVPASDEGESQDEQRKTEYHPMPLTFRVGLKNAVLDDDMHKVTLSADAINPLDYDLYGTMGAEYSYMGLGFIRLGCHLGHDTAGFSIGAGIEYENFTIDAAYSNYDILENHTQFGLGYKF
tara:strand:+ start:2419 stop:3393 length:975 start_codon:yes stop_codon:yes gene_type:complete